MRECKRAELKTSSKKTEESSIAVLVKRIKLNLYFYLSSGNSFWMVVIKAALISRDIKPIKPNTKPDVL